VTVGALDRRTLYMLLGGLSFIAVLRFGVYSDRSTPQVVSASESAPMAEKRLEQLRLKAATVAGKETVLKEANEQLMAREKGVLPVDTAAQGQAAILEILSRVAKANGIDARGAQEMREARPLGDDYAEVSVTVNFTCQIEQLVNLLAALGNLPEALATNEIHIAGGNDPKKKIIQVRLNLSGVAPRKVLPAKKGPGSQGTNRS
jgi:hypothetical protein